MAVGHAVNKINKMIESVKSKFRTLKSNVSQSLKSREQIRTYVTTQVNAFVSYANAEGIKEAFVAIRESIDRRLLSHFKSKKAFMQLLDPLRKRY